MSDNEEDKDFNDFWKMMAATSAVESIADLLSPNHEDMFHILGINFARYLFKHCDENQIDKTINDFVAQVRGAYSEMKAIEEDTEEIMH